MTLRVGLYIGIKRTYLGNTAKENRSLSLLSNHQLPEDIKQVITATESSKVQ